MPRDAVTPKGEKSKREELRTYRELALRRDLKSAAQRRRVAATGTRRVIGNGSDLQPYLAVEAKRYREVREEVTHQLLLRARASGLELPVDTLLGNLQPRIEALVYMRLAAENRQEAQRGLKLAALGRTLTPQEHARFAEAQGTLEPAAPANHRSRTALDRALGAIEQRQTHNPARHQAIWAEVVGGDAAQQSQLDHIDPATQTAWFRCYNSVLSVDLQRRRGLPAKLAKALGLPVRQLRARF